jgi:tripartite-type tricarboxylate transporter receptor subunit TctC
MVLTPTRRRRSGQRGLALDFVDPTTPESATAFINAETAKWAPLIRAAGIQGE